jgi:superfamily I DNA/RNA helicase
VPRIAYESPELRRDFRRASRQTQSKIEGFIRKFDEEAGRAGTQLKTPNGSPDRRVKVARVDQGLRAVLIDLGDDDFLLARVMEHDAAYEWASSLRVDVSSFDGRPRLLNLARAEAMAEAPVPSTSSNLFAHRSDTDFDLVGVPSFMIPALRALPSAREVIQLAELAGQADPLLGFAIHGLLETDRSVDDVFAELVALEGGPPDDEPRTDGVLNGTLESAPSARAFDTEDLGAALERPGAEERFRVVDGSDELVDALQGSFADWQVFLHPLQRRAAYSTTFSGPARVSGGAGTGKTIVLIHRAKALLDAAEHGDEPTILLTTLTPHLRRDLVALLRQLMGAERAATIDVRTVDNVAHDLHQRMGAEAVTALSDAAERHVWEEIAKSSSFTSTFLRHEYRHVVLARGVRNRDDYLSVPRTGRGVALRAPERLAVWPAIEEFEARTRQARRYTTLQLTEAVAALFEQLPSALYDHVLVDEAQDLHASQWRLLRAITTPGSNDMFIAGDAVQRIYGDTVSLRSIGIETRGRSLRLRRNYRTTHQIVAWALGLVGHETVVDLDELGADLTGYHSVRHGPAPQFRSWTTRQEELDGLAGAIECWAADGHGLGEIVVVERTDDDLEAVVGSLMRAGVSAGLMGRNGRLADMVNVTTMHRVKGLEFPCVAITGLSDARVPPPGALCDASEDPRQFALDLQTERSLVYVAATRARDELLVSWHGQPSSLLSQAEGWVSNDLAATEEKRA